MNNEKIMDSEDEIICDEESNQIDTENCPDENKKEKKWARPKSKSKRSKISTNKNTKTKVSELREKGILTSN